jgi:sigma-B regulation protein RsbU (phosphoserine phosphatase)
MLLRTRITLFLSIAFVLVAGGLILAGMRREEIADERFAEVAIDGQRSLWQSLVADELRTVTVIGDDLVAQIARARPVDVPRLRQVAASVIPGAADLLRGVEEVQVVDASGTIIYTNRPSIGQRPILDASALDRVLSTGVVLGGLRQDTPDRYVIAAGVPVFASGRPFAVVTLARGADGVLTRFADAFGVPSFLVSLRGRMVVGTRPDLWQALMPQIPPRSANVSVYEDDDRLFLATSVPVQDLIGGAAGTLVTFRDSSESLGEARDFQRATLAGVALFVALILAGLYVYLRQAFRPLESAISVLQALSAGDTNVRIEDAGEGEIRRIAETVAVFRRNAIAVAENQRQVERQRRRQERLIRRQMEALARTLEADGREQVLQDIQSIFGRQKAAPVAIQTIKRAGDEQLGLLAAVLQQMSARISDQHARLTELVAELREAIITRAKLAGLQQELEIARQLQLSILPKPLPPRSDVALHGLMVPAKEVGGDFFDYFFLDQRTLGIVVADVSGKGVPAAMFMAMTRTLLKATTLFSISPSASIERLNAVLAAENDQMMFVTLFYGVLDLSTGRLTYVNAGHNPPFLCRPDGSVTPLPRSGDIAIAVFEEAPYREMTIDLVAGDLVFLYTDGVTEAFDIDGTEFGEARLITLLKELPAGASAADVANFIVEGVHRFERGANHADDITSVGLRYFGAAAAPGTAATPLPPPSAPSAS